MSPLKKKGDNTLLGRVENVSEEIQLLALNIAVAAAKMAQKKDPGLEVHHKLSSLVNQATRAVKDMNKIVKAAKTEGIVENNPVNDADTDIDFGFAENIESSLNGIIADSERITRLLHELKKR
ncbi:MAG: hypothetical protein V3W18_08220 [candidate division Zixibacteria bacterium]